MIHKNGAVGEGQGRIEALGEGQGVNSYRSPVIQRLIAINTVNSKLINKYSEAKEREG